MEYIGNYWLGIILYMAIVVAVLTWCGFFGNISEEDSPKVSISAGTGCWPESWDWFLLQESAVMGW